LLSILCFLSLNTLLLVNGDWEAFNWTAGGSSYQEGVGYPYFASASTASGYAEAQELKFALDASKNQMFFDFGADLGTHSVYPNGTYITFKNRSQCFFTRYNWTSYQVWYANALSYDPAYSNFGNEKVDSCQSASPSNCGPGTDCSVNCKAKEYWGLVKDAATCNSTASVGLIQRVDGSLARWVFWNFAIFYGTGGSSGEYVGYDLRFGQKQPLDIGHSDLFNVPTACRNAQLLCPGLQPNAIGNPLTYFNIPNDPSYYTY